MVSQRCRVKVCGVTTVEDAQQASQLGVDALGLNFYPNSKRYISIRQARDICFNLPPFVSVVGLFLDAAADFVEEVMASVPLDLLQFHGSESPEYCAGFARPYIKALGMGGGLSASDFAIYAAQYAGAQGLLVDSHAPGAAGGTGETFDWTQVPKDCPKPIILAGGLVADNVAEAIRTTGVYAVDVSSGVEVSPGRKDQAKMTKFIQAVASTADL